MKGEKWNPNDRNASMDSEHPPSPKRRIALVLQYMGSHFHGWQRQGKERTVQAVIEDTLAEIVQHPVVLHGAGRTDTGVHAAAQVAHFETTSRVPPERWALILNNHLPKDILIRASADVPSRWHARFSASWRRYRYTIYTDPVPNLFVAPVSWHYYYAPLDPERMQQALNPLLGHHHLEAFHRANSSRSHSWVEVQAVECSQSGPLIHIEIQANGFLYGMVRLIVGLLVEVGTGKRTIAEFTDIWQNHRRDQVKYAAPAKGLCLLRVAYPEMPFPPEIWYDSQPKFSFPPEFPSDRLTVNGSSLGSSLASPSPLTPQP